MSQVGRRYSPRRIRASADQKSEEQLPSLITSNAFASEASGIAISYSCSWHSRRYSECLRERNSRHYNSFFLKSAISPETKSAMTAIASQARCSLVHNCGLPPIQDTNIR
jgi:hypothetical protein